MGLIVTATTRQKAHEKGFQTFLSGNVDLKRKKN